LTATGDLLEHSRARISLTAPRAPTKEDHVMPRSSLIVLVIALTIGMLSPGKVHALDAVLCVNVNGNGPPKFRAAKTKPPTPAACKPTELQIGHFDGTTLQFTGINVQIVSGSGATDGAVNGKGNLIVGYDEPGRCTGHFISPTLCKTNADCPVFGACADRGPKTGSHNVIVGAPNSYSAYGGVVAGERNAISGPFASVTGGTDNTASGEAASVSGGGGLGQPANGGWAAGSAEPGNVVVGNFESP
jgi:hypothetical protein